MSVNNVIRPPVWFSAFILLLVLLPLPFGANRPLFSNLFAVIISLVLGYMLWTEHGSTAPSSGSPPIKRLSLSAVGLTLVAIWSFFQVVPWTPDSWHHPVWKEASAILGPVTGSISVDPGLFPESIIRLVSYIACFLVAFTAGQEPKNAKRLISALAVAAVAYAGYGLLVESTGSDTILWYKKWAYSGFLTSTFVNKNSYAIYAGLGLLCCFAFAWQHFRELKPDDQILARRARNVAILSSLRVKDFAIAFMPIIVLGALALTGSRAGVACSIIGLIAFVVALAINQKWGLHRWTGIIIVAVISFVALVALGGDALVSRIDGTKLDNDASMRLSAYTLEKIAIEDNPWLGFGLGSFESAFRLYRDSSLTAWFHHAHNDYFEMIMDLGLPVAFILFLSVGLLISCCVDGVWKRRKNGVYPALALAATFTVGLHALVDFSFHIPAIAATYAALLGIGVAQSWSSRAQEPLSLRPAKAKRK